MNVLADGSLEPVNTTPTKSKNEIVIKDITNTPSTSKNTSDTNHQLSGKSRYPTPFKNSLFWPEKSIDNGNKIKKNVLTPTVAVSDEFIELKRRQKQQKENKERIKNLKKSKRVQQKDETKNKNENSKPKDITVGDYVIIQYEGEFFPGIVLKTKDSEYEVKTMTMSGKYWKWPKKDDILWYTKDDTLKICPPSIIDNKGNYEVPEIVLIKKKKLQVKKHYLK